MKPGDRVRTINDTMPVSTGRVKIVSDCSRYVRVRKRYGDKKSWVKAYHIDELKNLTEERL